MNRKIKFSEGEYYHVYNRGVEKRTIFLDTDDYRRFLLLLCLFNDGKSLTVRDFRRNDNCRGSTSANQETLVDIGAYCLMPNHFHILIKEKKEGGLRDFVHKLTTGYTMYFNKKYERVGPLFQGTFKAEHANSDEYLKYLFSYIHLNPLKIFDKDWKEDGLKDIDMAKSFLNEYEYSSYLDYHNPEKYKSEILCKSSFPEYFVSVDDFDNNIFDWMEYKINLQIAEVEPR